MPYLSYAAMAAALLILLAAVSLGIRQYLHRLVDKRISVYQNSLIEKHCDEVQNIYNQMRGWRHDYRHHIQAMKAYMSLNQLAEIDEYLNKLDTDLTSVDTILKTGNVMVDAILNSKISLAKSRKININASASVPNTLNVSEIDLCVITGNLLDNAIEACMKLPEEEQRFIRIYIGILKKQLYISITNSTGGTVKKSGKRYLTTKGANHGFGLARVDRIVEKYGGYMNRQNEEGVFATEIMLPL